MEKINLKAKIREGLGKEAAKKLRQKEQIPAVVYKGNNSLSLEVSAKDFQELISTKAGRNVIVNLQIDAEQQLKGESTGKSKSLSRTAIIKEIQYNPVRGTVLHVDFNEISLTEVLAVKVPIAVRGEAQGIKSGGVLEHALWEVEVECLPTQIPENIPVEASGLKIGDSILVKDLKVPEGVKVLSDPESVVIAVAAPRAEEEAVAPAEEMVEPEVIMEKKRLEEEAAEEAEKAKKPEKEK